MSGFVIQKKDVSEWLDLLGKSGSIYAPKYDSDSDTTRFAERAAGSVPDWDHLRTTVSLKEMFFPETECLIRYQQTDKGVELEETLPSDQPRVIFGTLACDTRSLLMLDKLFDGDEIDPYYQKRRENTALITVLCREPYEGCFCQLLDLPDGPWDVKLTDLGDVLVADSCTEKGQKLIDAGGKLFSKITPEESAEQKKVNTEFQGKFPEKLDLAVISEKLSKMWDDPLWTELSHRCIGCGGCSYICPTCHCFDIEDESAGNCGVRYRCWDTCQERDFTLMGAGHNPRPSRKERHRQRVMHKFAYFPIRFGLIACVGCGRCVEKCPVNIDIREVLKTVAGAKTP